MSLLVNLLLLDVLCWLLETSVLKKAARKRCYENTPRAPTISVTSSSESRSALCWLRGVRNDLSRRHGGATVCQSRSWGPTSLYWLLSISVLKNERRTTYFYESHRQLSEGLCVHF